jgi:uncharacterized membrane protein YraQ (UPF0718 family)
MKISTSRAIVFYVAAVAITVAVWLGLVSFARLPGGVHAKFVAGIFIPFLIGVIVLSDWVEKKRRASKSGRPKEPIQASETTRGK